MARNFIHKPSFLRYSDVNYMSRHMGFCDSKLHAYSKEFWRSDTHRSTHGLSRQQAHRFNIS